MVWYVGLAQYLKRDMCHSSQRSPSPAAICIHTWKGIGVRNRFPAKGNLSKTRLTHSLQLGYCCICFTIVTGTCISHTSGHTPVKVGACLPLYICLPLVLTKCDLFAIFSFQNEVFEHVWFRNFFKCRCSGLD